MPNGFDPCSFQAQRINPNRFIYSRENHNGIVQVVGQALESHISVYR